MNIDTLGKLLSLFCLVVLLSWIGVIVYSVKSVIDAGGVKAVIVEAGREIKDIARQINEEQ